MSIENGPPTGGGEGGHWLVVAHYHADHFYSRSPLVRINESVPEWHTCVSRGAPFSGWYAWKTIKPLLLSESAVDKPRPIDDHGHENNDLPFSCTGKFARKLAERALTVIQ